MKITDDVLAEFAAGWHGADTGNQPGGARRRAGLEAALAMPEVRRQIQLDACRACPVDQPCPSCTRDGQCECYEHQDVPEQNEAVERWTCAAAAYAVTDGVDEWNHMIEMWEQLPDAARAKLLEV